MGRELSTAGADVTSEKLGARDREILKDIIRSFILRGEPVSSRSVAKLPRHSLSAATIRNVMADLEEAGYLEQPHTSAGRVPTPEGYHFYIDSLMPSRIVSKRERNQIDGLLGSDADQLEPFMASASQLLSEMTHQIGIVLTPSVGETTLKVIDFVPLTGSKVLCVLVSASGFVDNKVIETAQPMKRGDLTRISNYLTDSYGGMTLREIRDHLVLAMSEERAKVDRLLGDAIFLARQALRETSEPGVFVKGTERVLAFPELASFERVQCLLETFSDQATLVQMLSQAIDGPGVRVAIGKDSDLTSTLDFSLVSTWYGTEDRAHGTLAIFGPSRMEYQKIIPLVNYFGERLSQALEQTFEDEDSPERLGAVE